MRYRIIERAVGHRSTQTVMREMSASTALPNARVKRLIKLG